MARIQRRIVRKDLNNSDNHNGVIIHLEPDILEYEVKWALGSITTNKASGGIGIPFELFQILRDDGVKVLHSICQQFWTTQQWPQDWKRCFHSNLKERQCQKFVVQTTAQLGLIHLLVRQCSKAETPVLWPPHAKSCLIGKDSDAGRDWGQEEKGITEDEMAGWHHWLDGRESKWTPGVGNGQRGLACCDSWGCKESDTTEWLNWTECSKSFKLDFNSLWTKNF